MKKTIKSKKIFFQQWYKFVDGLLKKPNPAIFYLPKWYKDQKIFSNEQTELVKATKAGEWHATYKLCVPLIDSLTAGYMIELPADIVVTNTNKDGFYTPFIQWAVDFEVLDSQSQETFGNYPVPIGYNNSLFRWYCNWQIITPKDYSLWITHPSHRHDLPFFTLSGFVDTDKHPNRLLFPFFIKEGFEGRIKEGTPIAQLIPIKREDWKSFEKKYSEQKYANAKNILKINFIRTYKNKYWSRKKYE